MQPNVTLPLVATDNCPDCGQGTTVLITADGVGTFHIGPYNEDTNTQTVYERCPGPGWMASFLPGLHQ